MAKLDITTKTARALLKPRTPPYWHRVEAGLYVGFRKMKTGEGTWHARRLGDDGKQKFRALETLEDLDTAVKLARAWAKGVESGANHKPTTVEAACKAYVAHQKTHVSLANGSDAEGRFKRLVYGKQIGAIKLDKLRTLQLRNWLDDQLDDDGDEDDMRRSKDSANRNLTAIKAALNLALKDRDVATDAGWKTVTPYPGVGRRRERYLDKTERASLLAKCPVDLRALATALLLTGARAGEIANAKVADLDVTQGTIRLDGKTGLRIVAVSTQAFEFFKAQSKDKLPAAPLLARTDGSAWNKDAWKGPFKTAVQEAKLTGEVVLYTLRHTAISDLVMAGMDSLVVAKLTGTSVAMIQKHYGHLQIDRMRERLDAVQLVSAS